VTDEPVTAPTTPLATGTAPGAFVENLYVRRTVTVLAVHEHEVQDIAFMNTLATIGFAVATAFAGFGVGILTAAAFADRIGDTARATLEIGLPICGLVAVIAIILGCVSLGRRKSTLTQIKQQSKSVSP
jgi:MFS family permease